MRISDKVICSFTQDSFGQRLLLSQRCSLRCVVYPAEYFFDYLQCNAVGEVAACTRRLVVGVETTRLLWMIWKYSLFDFSLLWQRYASACMLILIFCLVLAVLWMNGYRAHFLRTLSTLQLPFRNHTEILQCKLHFHIWEKVMQI
jgi:hypothetical protein